MLCIILTILWLDIPPQMDLFVKDGGTWARDTDKQKSLIHEIKRRTLDNWANDKKEGEFEILYKDGTKE